MKPVLIQHLIKHNKGKHKTQPISEAEKQELDNKAASAVFWALAIIVLVSLVAL